MKRNKEIRKLVRSKYFWMGLALLLFGIVINQISGFYLSEKYSGQLPILNDFILDKLPFFNIVWAYDLLSILAVALFIIFAYRNEIKKVSYFLFLFAIWQILRGIFIVLTPFGSPNNGATDLTGLFVGSLFREGVYPSGHTGSAFLAFLLASGMYKKVLGVFLIGIIITLLLGRGHYSIDIFSALIFAYAIYAFGENHLKKRLCSA